MGLNRSSQKNTRKKKGKTISSRKPSATTLPFLLEIGTEELPAAFISQALQDLAELGRSLLSECRLDYQALRTVGTSRRLALLVEGVQPRQSSLTQEVFGPPKSAGFDASGQPTKAAEGFAKSQGVRVEQLLIKQTPKGLYLAVEKHQRGQSAKQILTQSLSSMLAKLAYPKAMRWNASRTKFARPIRWMVALLGEQPITVEFAGIRSRPVTWAHRFYRIKGKNNGHGIPLPNASNYIARMKRLGVLVDPEERRMVISQQITALVKSAKGQIDPIHRDELVEEAVWGVEYPQAIIGTFKKEFLSIPKTVLISSMKEHQGFFSVVTKEGALLPKFVAVTNMPWGDSGLIIKGNERVLAARLNDAQYFFEEDLKRPLHERVSALDGILFHQKLGTVRQKVDRVGELIGWMAEHIGRHDLKGVCERATLLSKADLTTGMVGEFPTLQGIMGEDYAKHDGELSEVCKAIGEQYLPRFPEDHLPTSLPGMLLACADRCDSIVAFFAVGMAPSGSSDPLGLRRAAYGLVRIVTETPIRLNMVSMVDKVMQLLEGQGLIQGTPQICSDVVSFIIDRLRFYARQTLELQEDVMEAVTRVRPPEMCDLADLLSRMQALQAIMIRPDFEPLIIGFKRVHRIVEKEQWSRTHLSAELFQHKSEEGLSQALDVAQQSVTLSVNKQNYGQALQALLELKSPIDDFFAAVLVNDPDPVTRGNRLSLLTAIDRLFLTIADFSCIQSAGVAGG